MSAPGTAPRLRLGFAGTPAFAATILQALIEAGRPPVVVYTQPDRRKGRGRRPTPPPVKTLAEARGIEVRQPESLRGRDAAEALAALSLDVLAVAAYGLILPPRILEIPNIGCINVHASLLPRWRGAAPVERAIMAGDRETGVSIMHMDRGLDTGPVYLERACAITEAVDGPALEDHLARLGAEALLTCLDELPGLQPVPQPESGVTYAGKLTRDDAEIRWSASARQIERQVRALRGRMPAGTPAGDVRVSVLEAAVEAAPERGHARAPGSVLSADSNGIRVACGEGVLVLSRLRLSVGKGRPLAAADVLNGYPGLFPVDSVLGASEPGG